MKKCNRWRDCKKRRILKENAQLRNELDMLKMKKVPVIVQTENAKIERVMVQYMTSRFSKVPHEEVVNMMAHSMADGLKNCMHLDCRKDEDGDMIYTGELRVVLSERMKHC